jgi:hypothetical protein
LEPCHEPPFEVVGPVLFEKLSQITSVVAVLQDWDKSREEFLRRVKMAGVELRVIVVKDGTTTEPLHTVGEDLGQLTVMSPAEVEEAIVASEQ